MLAAAKLPLTLIVASESLAKVPAELLASAPVTLKTPVNWLLISPLSVPAKFAVPAFRNILADTVPSEVNVEPALLSIAPATVSLSSAPT